MDNEDLLKKISDVISKVTKSWRLKVEAKHKGDYQKERCLGEGAQGGR